MNNGIFQIKEGLAEIYRDRRTNTAGPWYAVVLHTEVTTDPGTAAPSGPLTIIL